MSGIIGVSPNMKSGVIGKFLAGNIIQQKQLLRRNDAAELNIDTATLTEVSGGSGTFTPLVASTSSLLKFEFFSSMVTNPAGNYGEYTMTLRGGSHTNTHADADDMLGTANYKNYQGTTDGGYSGAKTAVFYSGNESDSTANVSNLSSWTAGETLYWVLYHKTTGSGDFIIYHGNSTLTIWLQEIAI